MPAAAGPAAIVGRRSLASIAAALGRVVGTVVIVWGGTGFLFWYALCAVREYLEERKPPPHAPPPPTARQRLFDACRQGDAAAADAALADGAALHHCEAGGYTPLLLAVVHGQAELADHLLQLGADVAARNEGVGRTALHIAAAAGHERLTQTLLGAGAAVSVQDRWHGYTPLHLATAHGHKACVK